MRGTGRRSAVGAPSGFRGGLVGVAAIVLAGLSACSTIPDAYNPVAWVKDAQGWFGSSQKQASDEQRKAKDNKAKDKVRATEEAADPKAFPKLATVPDRPPRSTPEERKQIAEGLIADRANARYTDEVLRRQTDSPFPLPASPTLRRNADGPPPPAAPEPARVTATTRPAPLVEPMATPKAPVVEPSLSRSPVAKAPEPPAREGPAVEASPPGPPTTSRTAPVGAVEVEPPPPPPPMPVEPAVARAPPPIPAPAASFRSGSSTQVAALPSAPASAASPIPPPAPPAFEPSAGRRESAAPVPLPEPEPNVAALPAAGAQPLSTPGDGQQIATVLFEDGSADIAPGAIKLLERVVALHRSRGGQIRVVGHASVDVPGGDPLHKRLVNFRVSTDRANAVARELVRLGVDPAAISLLSVSESQPLYNESVPAGEAGNRRAEIYLDQRG